MDLIQIVSIVFVCWFCYRTGVQNGARAVLLKLEEAGVVKIQRPEDSEESD
jgi:hypothetical protein